MIALRAPGIGICLALVLSATRLVRAEQGAPGSDSREQASKLHGDAERALKSNDWATACRLYEESQALDASATTAARIAQCREHEGRFASAVREYELAMSLVDKLDPERGKRAGELFPRKIAELVPRVPRLTLAPLPAIEGLTIEVDGTPLGGSELNTQVAVDPGSHSVAVNAPGYVPVRCQFEALEGSRTEAVLNVKGERGDPCRVVEKHRLIIALQAAPPAGDSAAPRATAAPPAVPERPKATIPEEVHPDRGRSAQRTIGWALGGAGIVSLGVAGFFGIRTLSLVGDADCDEQNRCSQDGVDTIDKAADSQTIGFVAAAAGAALLGGGITLLVLGQDPSREARPARTVLVNATPGGASLAATW